MSTFGDLRGAIEDARLTPTRLGAHDALAAGDPAEPLAEMFAFCVDGFDTLRVVVAIGFGAES